MGNTWILSWMGVCSCLCPCSRAELSRWTVTTAVNASELACDTGVPGWAWWKSSRHVLWSPDISGFLWETVWVHRLGVKVTWQAPWELTVYPGRCHWRGVPHTPSLIGVYWLLWGQVRSQQECTWCLLWLLLVGSGYHSIPATYLPSFLSALGIWEHWVSPAIAHYDIVTLQVDAGQRWPHLVGPSGKFYSYSGGKKA